MAYSVVTIYVLPSLIYNPNKFYFRVLTNTLFWLEIGTGRNLNLVKLLVKLNYLQKSIGYIGNYTCLKL